MCSQEEDFSDIVARVDSPGGDSLTKGAEMLVGNFELNPWRRSTFFWPLKETILIFYYMNGVIKRTDNR